MKAFLLIFLAALSVVTFSYGSGEKAHNWTDVVAKARPAVVLLEINDSAGRQVATGTGFFCSSDGTLVTSYHVVQNASAVIAKADSGAFYRVRGVLADDEENDLAVLKAEAKTTPFLRLGDSTQVKVGERVAVIGNPLGLEGTISDGVVSALRQLESQHRWIQITAAISPGSSGSPVLDAAGNVIGVASMLIRGGQSLNFAVPSALLAELMTKVQTGSVRPFVTASTAVELTRPALEELSRIYKLLMRQQRAKGLEAAKAFAEKYPVSLEAQQVLAMAYNSAGLHEASIDTCKKALTIFETDPKLWRTLGDAYAGNENHQAAAEAYKKCIRHDPADPRGWHSLAGALVELGRDFEAIAACREALQLDPDFSSAYALLGTIQVKAGDTEGGREYFKKALEASKREADRLKNR